MNPGKRARTRALNCERLENRCLLTLAPLGIELVSTGSPGDPAAEVGNDSSTRPAISANGQYVAFCSEASNLVPGDNNGTSDVFLKDLATGELRLVSVSFKGEQGDGAAPYSPPAISADGRFVAFASQASNLVNKDDNGSTADIFVKDMVTGKVKLVSQTASHRQSSSDAETPAISADGRFVAFVGGDYEGLGGYGVYLKDLKTNRLELVAEGWSWEVSLSGDGQVVVFGTGFIGNIWARDMRSGESMLVSAASDGTPANRGSFPGSISADGRYVAFGSYATNLVADDGNGSYVDIFLKDLATGEIRLVSDSQDGIPGNDAAFFASLSADGRYVAFQSYASNLVADDTNGIGADVFVRDLWTDELVIVSNTEDAIPYLDRSFTRPVISADGQYIAFDSDAAGHVSGDTNNTYDIFRVKLQTSDELLCNAHTEVIPESKAGAAIDAVFAGHFRPDEGTSRDRYFLLEDEPWLAKLRRWRFEFAFEE